jgi:hypothetical protein
VDPIVVVDKYPNPISISLAVTIQKKSRVAHTNYRTNKSPNLLAARKNNKRLQTSPPFEFVDIFGVLNKHTTSFSHFKIIIITAGN